MSILKGKKILIFQQRGWGRRIGRFLAKKLYDEGARLAALTFQRTAHGLILEQPDIKYDLILNNDEIMGRPRDYLAGDIFSLKEICQALDIDSIWPIVHTLRNHVYSYKDKFYYSFKQNVPDEEIIDFVMAVYKYIKFFFENFGPDIIITPNFVALPHIMMNLFASRHDVPMVAVTDSKIKSYFIFTEDYLHTKGTFYARVEALNAGLFDSSNRERAKQYIKEFRESFKQQDYTERYFQKKTLWQKIKHELRPYREILRWYTNRSINYLESTRITLDWRPPKIILRDHYCQKRYKRFMDKFNYEPLKKIKKYIYFPLQFQPEETIEAQAPYFCNQIETARQVAMSLPDDYSLVVKEHPGMIGLRPPSYIEKVNRTVNVKLIDFRISNEKVIKGADLIISPSSTTIAEAAFLKKPVIQIGNLGTTLKLPNVFKHTDMTNLGEKIKEVLKVNLNTDDYERRLENFVAAVYDTGFNVDYLAAWERGETLEPLWQIYKKEIERTLTKRYENFQ